MIRPAHRIDLFGALLSAVILAAAPAGAQPDPQHANAPKTTGSVFTGPQLAIVSLGPQVTTARAGRLIIVAQPVASVRQASPVSLGTDGGWLGAVEVDLLTPGAPRKVDVEVQASPGPLSSAPPGEYWVQGRLDTNHNAAYSWGDPDNDLVSPPVKMRLPSSDPIALALEPEGGFIRARAAAEGKPAPVLRRELPAGPLTDEFKAHWHAIDFESPSLAAFWGRPMHIRGFVLTPPDYETMPGRYPTVYRTEGFGASLENLQFPAIGIYKLMKEEQDPPMIRVFLDHHSPWGTHEFADSVNNGPWGTALTKELIPALERQYRMDGKASGRFVTGHSSGGWFAMWQQVAYPDVFGGAWASSPDPTDFRSFTGVDLYRAGANAYTRPDGKAQYLVRDAKGNEVQSLREYAQSENVLGDIGGQFDSFDWVFSPKGDDGRPQPIFDRATGAVDPVVAIYWREHYDISNIIRRDWKTLKPKLDGKIHLNVGDVDTFHLDEAAHLLQQEMDKLGAKSGFTYVPGGTHFNTNMINGDPNGLEKRFAWEMYAVARPGSKLKPPPKPPSPKPAQTPPG